MAVITWTLLADFLEARIAEDEAETRNAYPSNDGYEVMCDRDGDLFLSVGTGRVLAECQAKRLIVDMAREVKRAAGNAWDGDLLAFSTVFAEDALQALAWPYRDHPDYRPEWIATPHRAGLV